MSTVWDSGQGKDGLITLCSFIICVVYFLFGLSDMAFLSAVRWMKAYAVCVAMPLFSVPWSSLH